MKKIISAIMLTMALVGSAAQAFEGIIVPGPNGEIKIQPLRGNCDQVPQPAAVGDTKAMGACNPGTKTCPEGYNRAAKFCWGGWHHGFYKCGYACQEKPKCDYGPQYNYQCGNPGNGGRGHN